MCLSFLVLTPMNFQSILQKRRDGIKHSQSDLGELANGAADGSIPDYQLSAWLMAAYLNPLDAEETAWLTMAMADSGSRLDLRGLPRPWVDKHSTGGVGDKTSIALLPILASCGLTVVKMSGRGLGITGGTVDKLSSIPGFRIDLSPEQLKDQARRIGIALTGQTPNLAPADKTLYALRDATTTVGSIPLIVSSILSKKLAGGAETVVLDVKCGRGAFMQTLDDAHDLASALAKTGELCGLKVRIAISDMNQPLGHAVGNALEVKEAVRTLKGEQSRFADLCVELAGLTLEASGLLPSQAAGKESALDAIRSGRAADKARQWFEAQGATVDVVSFPELLPKSPFVETHRYQGPGGWIASIDAESVGSTVVSIGGGRPKKDSQIDLSVGVEMHVEVGSNVQSGDPLFSVFTNSKQDAARASEELSRAIAISPTEVSAIPALITVV